MLGQRLQLLVTLCNYKQLCSHQQAGAEQAANEAHTAHKGTG